MTRALVFLAAGLVTFMAMVAVLKFQHGHSDPDAGLGLLVMIIAAIVYGVTRPAPHD